jgi:hypothetical protein
MFFVFFWQYWGCGTPVLTLRSKCSTLRHSTSSNYVFLKGPKRESVEKVYLGKDLKAIPLNFILQAVGNN